MKAKETKENARRSFFFELNSKKIHVHLFVNTALTCSVFGSKIGRHGYPSDAQTAEFHARS